VSSLLSSRRSELGNDAGIILMLVEIEKDISYEEVAR